VKAVFYPGLNAAQKVIMQKQMSGGGSVLAFELHAGYDAAAMVMSQVKRMTPAVSLGSVDTLIQHPAGLTHRVLDEGTRQKTGIREGLMRVSVGIEHVDDLIADLSQAFAAIKQQNAA